MLPFLAPYLTSFWGPFRLLESYLVLICLGATLTAFFSWYLLPRLWHLLPRDQGKPFVKDSREAKGKPTGAGVILVCLTFLVILLVLPFSWRLFGIAICLLVCMLAGFLDDCSDPPWAAWKKGTVDMLISLAAAAVLCQGQAMVIWLPLCKGAASGGGYLIPAWQYIPLAACLLWFCINAVNCSDGVDGLAGSLSLLTLFCMGTFLYGIVGHAGIAKYLLLPHYRDGARWAIIIYASCGGLAGYLWHNANPSAVLMGDAGSRFLGLLIGLSVLAAGNPFLAIAVAPILLANGGGGLGKIVLLRLLRKAGFDTRPPARNVVNADGNNNKVASDHEAEKQILPVRLAHSYCFPFHDHCRKNWNWSNTQVLVRFMLLQSMIIPLLFLLLIKLR